MGTKKRIAILCHEYDRHKDLGYYLVYYFSKFWRDLGYQVEFLFGAEDYSPADVAILHVDLSVIPEEYLALAARYPICLNGKVSDIRKTAFSTNLLAPDDIYSGPVIVKSDLNNAGSPERYYRQLSGRHRPSNQRRAFQFRSAADYLVYNTLDDVPAELHRNPDLIVERFLPEYEDGLYHTRLYHFLGEHESCSRLGSTHPVVYGASCRRLETVDPHPDIVELRHAMNFDYGKFDYVVHHGRAVLLDINKTTGTGRLRRTPERLSKWRNRSLGICKYLE